jgi:ammonia channel protein AmtB
MKATLAALALLSSIAAWLTGNRFLRKKAAIVLVVAGCVVGLVLACIFSVSLFQRFVASVAWCSEQN